MDKEPPARVGVRPLDCNPPGDYRSSSTTVDHDGTCRGSQPPQYDDPWPLVADMNCSYLSNLCCALHGNHCV